MSLRQRFFENQGLIRDRLSGPQEPKCHEILMVAKSEKQWDKNTNCVKNDNFDDDVQMKTKSLPYDRSRGEFPESQVLARVLPK